MTPDRKDYSLDEVALCHAHIDPMTSRDRIACAVERRLPGCYQAEAYLMQLYEQVEAGTLKPTRVLTPPEGVTGSDEIFISQEDAESWQPEALPFQPGNHKSSQEDRPSQPGRLLMLGLLIKELKCYEPDKTGLQDIIIAHFKELAGKYKVYSNLSRTTLQRNIKAALNKVKEISKEHDS